MTLRLRIALALLLAPFVIANSAMAQEDAPPNVAVVEIYLCSYADGKGPNDLDKVVSKWNKWADKNFDAAYSAWTLEPVITGNYFQADLGWLGVWQNGSDMGKVIGNWVNQDGEMAAEFDEVIPCSSHSAFSSINYKVPAGENWPGKNGTRSVTVFSDCTVAEGKTFEDVDAAHTAWAEHLSASGSEAGMWVFMPAFGADDLNGHYKVVMGYPSYEAWGNDHNAYTNGGGWRKAREISKGVIQCDSPRVYDSNLRRNGGITAN
jgi:hypothetical protein